MSELQLNFGIPDLRQIAMPKQDKGGGINHRRFRLLRSL